VVYNPDQVVIHEVLNLQPLRSRIAAATRRDAALAGQGEHRRGVMRSKPVLADTRVPVETVRRYLRAGRSVEQIPESFPTLTAADVEAVRVGRLTLRFVCDHDVDAAVAATLRRLGQDAWTAANAGLSAVSDDELTVYADNQSAALLTYDVEFSRRRERNVIGKHVWLRCSEMEAAGLIEGRIGSAVGGRGINRGAKPRGPLRRGAT
jgi:predicted nuclease of predicted toxin-antitoxin system